MNDLEREVQFEPNDDTDFVAIAYNSNSIPKALEGGYVLTNLDVDNVY